MKVLVTGGAGYIGAELVYQLSKDARITEIVVFDNLDRNNFNLFISKNNKISTNKVSFIHADLLDTRRLNAAIKGCEVVFHLAAKVGTPFENVDSHVYEQVNHWGTAEVTYAVEESDSVKKFVYVSSTGVYGPTKRGVLVNEDSNLNPQSFYAISKMRGERHVERIMKKIDTVILRAGNVYGYSPTVRFDGVMNKFLFDAHFLNKVTINGSGKQTRPFIHLEKVVDTMIAAGVEGVVPSGTYNLADLNINILDILDVFKEVYPNLEFTFINQHLELRDIAIADNEKINKFVSFSKPNLTEELISFKENYLAF